MLTGLLIVELANGVVGNRWDNAGFRCAGEIQDSEHVAKAGTVNKIEEDTQGQTTQFNVGVDEHKAAGCHDHQHRQHDEVPVWRANFIAAKRLVLSENPTVAMCQALSQQSLLIVGLRSVLFHHFFLTLVWAANNLQF